jgi:GAF domain-containing protein
MRFELSIRNPDPGLLERLSGLNKLSTAHEPVLSLFPAQVRCLPSSFPIFPEGNHSMQRSLVAGDVNFLCMQSSIFCVQCELISENNTPHCLACGSSAVLSLSRLLGGSLRGQQTAHLIADAELDRLVRSLLYTVPLATGFGRDYNDRTRHDRTGDHRTGDDPTGDDRTSEDHVLHSPSATRHGMRPRHHTAISVQHALLNAGDIDLEPGISIIAEKAQALTGATGAAIALRRGNEIVCRARTGRTAPDIGVRLQTDSGLSAECVRTGEVLLCNDADANSRVDSASCRRMGVRSILVAPLRHFRRTLGVFEVLSSTPHAFDNNDVATMQFLSGMMVATISRLSSLQPVTPLASGE